MSQISYVLQEKLGEPKLALRDIPEPKSNEVLVKVIAAALNPIDYAIPDIGFIIEDPNFPTVLGYDGAGTIKSLGSAVQGNLAIGDTVFYQGEICNIDAGCLQEYAVIPHDLLAKVPDNVTAAEASSIPVAILIALLGFYHETGYNLTPPWISGGINKYVGQHIFICGGSSSVGQFAIQLAKLSGFTVFTTASATHTEYLKSLGADKVFPRSATADEIKNEAAPGVFKHSFIAVRTDETEFLGASVLEQDESSTMFLTRPPAINEWREGKVCVKTSIGSGYMFPDFVRPFWQCVSLWLKDGLLKPNRVEIVDGGLEGAAAGIDRLRKNKVSGIKLVVEPDKTSMAQFTPKRN